MADAIDVKVVSNCRRVFGATGRVFMALRSCSYCLNRGILTSTGLGEKWPKAGGNMLGGYDGGSATGDGMLESQSSSLIKLGRDNSSERSLKMEVSWFFFDGEVELYLSQR